VEIPQALVKRREITHPIRRLRIYYEYTPLAVPSIKTPLAVPAKVDAFILAI
jgi:hypothetical protein